MQVLTPRVASAWQEKLERLQRNIELTIVERNTARATAADAPQTNRVETFMALEFLLRAYPATAQPLPDKVAPVL